MVLFNYNPMAMRQIEETPLRTILTNFKVMGLFIMYWFARLIRPLFNWEKPMTLSEFVNNPRRSLIEVVLA